MDLLNKSVPLTLQVDAEGATQAGENSAQPESGRGEGSKFKSWFEGLGVRV